MCRAARRLLLFVLPVECIAGLTFDAVYGELRTPDVAGTTALTRPEPTHACRQRQDTRASRTIRPVVTPAVTVSASTSSRGSPSRVRPVTAGREPGGESAHGRPCRAARWRTAGLLHVTAVHGEART